MTALAVVLAAGGGFLLAVLWMDLMFDVQVLRHRGRAELPEPVLASIAGYYARVTGTARPMGHLVGTVMGITLVAAVARLATDEGARAQAGVALLLCGFPIALAFVRVLPRAVRLGTRADSTPVQSELARSVCRDHLLCLAGIVGFLAVQLATALR